MEDNAMGTDYGLSRSLAHQVLKLKFSERETNRMHDLAAKNLEGTLSKQESDELDNYVKVGDLLAILQSKARKLLKRTPTKKTS
jgi:hypothetical protein